MVRGAVGVAGVTFVAAVGLAAGGAAAAGVFWDGAVVCDDVVVVVAVAGAVAGGAVVAAVPAFAGGLAGGALSSSDCGVAAFTDGEVGSAAFGVLPTAGCTGVVPAPCATTTDDVAAMINEASRYWVERRIVESSLQPVWNVMTRRKMAAEHTHTGEHDRFACRPQVRSLTETVMCPLFDAA